jgi:hypothetical protein
VSFNTGFSRNYRQYPYGGYDQIGDDSLLFPARRRDRRRPLKELTLGVVRATGVKGYPYGALGERSAVNDEVGGRPVLVVFDAEAQMALAFDRQADGETLTFEVEGTNGFPFHLRDVEAGSRWTLDGAAVGGPLTGSRIEQIATFSAMWFAWAIFQPDTELYAP